MDQAISNPSFSEEKNKERKSHEKKKSKKKHVTTDTLILDQYDMRHTKAIENAMLATDYATRF